MKMRFLALLLILSLVLGGCGTPAPAETTAPETTAAPTEPPEVKEVFTWEDMKGLLPELSGKPLPQYPVHLRQEGHAPDHGQRLLREVYAGLVQPQDGAR